MTAEIARYFDVYYMTVSKAVRAAEGRFDGCLNVETALFSLSTFSCGKLLICRKKSIDRTHEFPINLPWNAGHLA